MKKISHFFRRAQNALPAIVLDPTSGLIDRISVWIGRLTPVLAGLALVVFFWGLVKFIFHAGDEEMRKEGKKFMMWGIIALFVVVAIWGIVAFIAISLGVGTGGSATAPCLEGLPGCSPLGIFGGSLFQ